MKSFQDQVTTGQNQNVNAVPVNAPKPMPFPLENLDSDLSEAYVYLDRIHKKLKNSQLNPVNKTPARKKRLKSLQYKTATCLQMIKEISGSLNDFWF